MLNKLTVTIGIPAYNEEKNIGNLLKSILKQKEKIIKIKEIYVISDGSTDDTVIIAKSIKDPRIQIIDDKKRLGQPFRIQELLQRFKSDYLVLLDADLIMKDANVIQHLIKKIASGKNVGLAAAHMRPTSPKTFLESAINNYRYAREAVESEFSFGKRVWSAHGCVVYSKEFGKSLYIPQHILSVDSFSYYSCVVRGYKHEYAKNAIVLYRSPQTLRDHISQATRHYVGGLQLYDYFDKRMIEKEKFVPTSINIKLMLYQLFHNPLGYLFLKLVNMYCLYKSKQTILSADSKWRVVLSTKRI